MCSGGRSWTDQLDSSDSETTELTALPKSIPPPPPAFLFSLNFLFCPALHFLAFFSISALLRVPKKSPSILSSEEGPPFGCPVNPGGAPKPGGADMMSEGSREVKVYKVEEIPKVPCIQVRTKVAKPRDRVDASVADRITPMWHLAHSEWGSSWYRIPSRHYLT